MRFPKQKPHWFVFNPWVHWQEITQNRKADFWVRYLHIGRLMILWDAPKNGTPNRIAHIRGTEETKLRIPKEKP